MVWVTRKKENIKELGGLDNLMVRQVAEQQQQKLLTTSKTGETKYEDVVTWDNELRPLVWTGTIARATQWELWSCWRWQPPIAEKQRYTYPGLLSSFNIPILSHTNSSQMEASGPWSLGNLVPWPSPLQYRTEWGKGGKWIWEPKKEMSTSYTQHRRRQLGIQRQGPR